MSHTLVNMDELDALGVLRHIVDHFASGGTQLSAESTLALAAQRILRTTASSATRGGEGEPPPVERGHAPEPPGREKSGGISLVRHTLPIRPGLTDEQKARAASALDIQCGACKGAGHVYDAEEAGLWVERASDRIARDVVALCARFSGLASQRETVRVADPRKLAPPTPKLAGGALVVLGAEFAAQ